MEVGDTAGAWCAVELRITDIVQTVATNRTGVINTAMPGADLPINVDLQGVDA